MTGEITLRGRVLPIGGLKEKLLAALRAGIKTVVIPEENVKDLAEIGDEVKSHLEIVPASRMDDVLKVALQRMPKPIPVEEEAAAVASPPRSRRSRASRRIDRAGAPADWRAEHSQALGSSCGSDLLKCPICLADLARCAVGELGLAGIGRDVRVPRLPQTADASLAHADGVQSIRQLWIARKWRIPRNFRLTAVVFGRCFALAAAPAAAESRPRERP